MSDMEVQMDIENHEYLARLRTGHPGSIYGTNQAGLPEAFERVLRESRKFNAVNTTHQVILGKSRDGMNGFGMCMSKSSGASRATGLLASLLRRI